MSIEMPNFVFIRRYILKYGADESIAYKRLHEILYKYGEECSDILDWILSKGRLFNELQFLSYKAMKPHLEAVKTLLCLADPEQRDKPYGARQEFISCGHMRISAYVPSDPRKTWYAEDALLAPIESGIYDFIWHLRRKAKSSLYPSGWRTDALQRKTELFWSLEDDYGNLVMAEKPYDAVWGYVPMKR